MSLLNNVRQSLSGAADTIAERGHQLSELAKLQVIIKKYQLDRAKRLHDLGSRIYALYKIEEQQTPLPPEIHELCGRIAEIDRQMEDAQRQMERQREELAKRDNTPLEEEAPAAEAEEPAGVAT